MQNYIYKPNIYRMCAMCEVYGFALGVGIFVFDILMHGAVIT